MITLYRRFIDRRRSVGNAITGMNKALVKLRHAADHAERRAAAELRLVEKHQAMAFAANEERNRAVRVSDKLEDLLA